jgi:DNA-binding LacI/PurR family transcriptional regulator
VQHRRASGHHRLVAGDRPQEGLRGSDCRQVELQDRSQQTGDFTRTKGKEVMESFLKAENGGKDICALYAHNDDMAVGAIQAIKEAGLKPGKDILVVSIDAVPDIFKAMEAGEANATVELTPNMAGPAFDALDAYLKDKKAPPSGSRPNRSSTPRLTIRRRSTSPRRASAIDLTREPHRSIMDRCGTAAKVARHHVGLQSGQIGQYQEEIS